MFSRHLVFEHTKLLRRTLLPLSLRTISTKPPPRPRSHRLARRVAYVSVGIGSIWASAISRNCRTLWTCAIITLDYKYNFTPEKSHLISELHERVADRMYNLSIGSNAAVLPPVMQQMFAKLFDDAPQISYNTGQICVSPGIWKTSRRSYWPAVASASIAQVHRALTWPSPEHPNGEWVAVKIQKPEVNQQIWWDLNAYRLVMWLFEKNFELPVYFLVDFISDHLMQELDFINEANNSIRTAQFIAADPNLRDRVYIPKVFKELSTKKIMTAEWIDGIRFSDKEAVLRLVGERPPLEGATAKPLKGGSKFIMDTMVELFSAQMFDWGWIHCDPHPGNIIIHANPSRPRYPRLVLLDHGLYVSASPTVRRDWATVWQAMMINDREAVRTVIRGWGIALPDLFATMTMMRPTSLNGRRKGLTEKQKAEMQKFLNETEYERSVRTKKILKGFLVDTDKMPKELIFIMRSMRMVQGHNQSFGAPVNRIRITADYASRSLTRTHGATFSVWLKDLWSHVLFRSFLFTLDAAFIWNGLKTWTYSLVGWKVGNFEDDLEAFMRGVAKQTTGVEITEKSNVFYG
ncbi:ABC1 family-domain-containing protein [Flagelloscypha sp. PMI_526]|nr:ABC1 family-domain-containing protein [Flagelloscypha sp. PMI_526]